MKDLTELEWKILDSLADGEESVGTMEIQDFSISEVCKAVYKLYKRGLIKASDEPVHLDILMNDTNAHDSPHYWFGLTSTGVEYWEEGAKRYSDGPMDWACAWSGHIARKSKEGYIDGTSEGVCMDALKKLKLDEDWQIDMNTLNLTKIEGFQAKYYKYIQGGYRISFKFKIKPRY